MPAKSKDLLLANAPPDQESVRGVDSIVAQRTPRARNKPTPQGAAAGAVASVSAGRKLRQARIQRSIAGAADDQINEKRRRNRR
jgi:hypothetical protein